MFYRKTALPVENEQELQHDRVQAKRKNANSGKATRGSARGGLRAFASRTWSPDGSEQLSNGRETPIIEVLGSSPRPRLCMPSESW